MNRATKPHVITGGTSHPPSPELKHTTRGTYDILNAVRSSPVPLLAVLVTVKDYLVSEHYSLTGHKYSSSKS